MKTDTPLVYPDNGTTGDPLELWSLANLFRPDWSAGGVSITTEWYTTITAARSGAEQRVGRVGKPFRSMRYSTKALVGDELAQLTNQLRRFASATSPVPLWPHFLTLDHTSGTTWFLAPGQAQADYLNARQIKVGDRVCAARHSPGRMEMLFGYRTVNAANAGLSTITVDDTLTVLPGDRIYPVMECQPVLDSAADLLNLAKAGSEITLQEFPGPRALDPLCAPGTNPTGFATYGGLPILDLPTIQSQTRVRITRGGTIDRLGIGTTIELQHARPLAGFEVTFQALTRATADKLGAFFDSRAGMVHPFWLPCPIVEFTITAFLSSTIVNVRTGLPEYDIDQGPGYLGFRTKTGAYVVSKINSRTRIGGGIDQFTLNDPLPYTGTLDYIRCGFAYLCRFGSDSLTINWETDTIATASAPVYELIEEKAVSLTVPDPVQGGAAADYLPCDIKSPPEQRFCEDPCGQNVVMLIKNPTTLSVKKYGWTYNSGTGHVAAASSVPPCTLPGSYLTAVYRSTNGSPTFILDNEASDAIPGTCGTLTRVATIPLDCVRNGYGQYADFWNAADRVAVLSAIGHYLGDPDDLPGGAHPHIRFDLFDYGPEYGYQVRARAIGDPLSLSVPVEIAVPDGVMLGNCPDLRQDNPGTGPIDRLDCLTYPFPDCSAYFKFSRGTASGLASAGGIFYCGCNDTFDCNHQIGCETPCTGGCPETITIGPQTYRWCACALLVGGLCLSEGLGPVVDACCYCTTFNPSFV